MEIKNVRIRSAIQKHDSSNIFMHKNTFYGKFSHLRRGIKRISSQSDSNKNKTKKQDSNIRMLTQPSKSLCFNNYFKPYKTRELGFKHLESNSKSVNLNKKNPYFSSQILSDHSKKTNLYSKRKRAFINGCQVYINKNQDQKINRNSTVCIRQFCKPFSRMEAFLCRNKRNFKDNQLLRVIQHKPEKQQCKADHQKVGNQNSLKTTTNESLRHQLYNPSIEFQDNQPLLIEILSPKKSEQLQTRFQQNKLSRQKKVLIIQKTKQNEKGIEQLSSSNFQSQKARKMIQKIKIKIDRPYQIGPWSKKLQPAQDVQESLPN